MKILVKIEDGRAQYREWSEMHKRWMMSEAPATDEELALQAKKDRAAHLMRTFQSHTPEYAQLCKDLAEVNHA